MQKIEHLKIVLGSGSPRRKQLLQEAGFSIRVMTKEIDETPPLGLVREAIAIKLAEMKAHELKPEINNDEILVTADTIVCFEDQVLNKPSTKTEALEMLETLNGKTHQVYTGVCVVKNEKSISFAVATNVHFNDLSKSQLENYIDEFKPYDKAGSYGAQESLPITMNPCSEEEIKFMEKINKPNLLDNCIVRDKQMKNPLIKKIDGSFFNVMGLPIVELTETLLDGQFN